MNRQWRLWGVAVLVSSGIATTARAGARYTVTPLGVLGADAQGASRASGGPINSGGLMVGAAEAFVAGQSAGMRAVRWDAGPGAPTLLSYPTPPDAYAISSRATGVNAAGVVIGLGQSNWGDQAVRWDAGSLTGTLLGTLGANPLGGTVSAHATGLNAGGAAVGYTDKYTGSQALGVRAVRWDAGQTHAVELAQPAHARTAYSLSYATAINDPGTIVGYTEWNSQGDNWGSRAVRWDAVTGEAEELPDLAVTGGGYAVSVATAVNNGGTVAGYAYKFSDQGEYLGVRAVRWEPGGGAPIELMPTKDGIEVYPVAINSTGAVVGYENYGNQVYHPVLWPAGSTEPVELNSVIDPFLGHLVTADGINDLGQIVCSGSYTAPDGSASGGRAFLLTPVPEPGVGTLLAVACVHRLLGGRARRWRRTPAARD